jgi:hypothetical protein
MHLVQYIANRDRSLSELSTSGTTSISAISSATMWRQYYRSCLRHSTRTPKAIGTGKEPLMHSVDTFLTRQNNPWHGLQCDEAFHGNKSPALRRLLPRLQRAPKLGRQERRGQKGKMVQIGRASFSNEVGYRPATTETKGRSRRDTRQSTATGCAQATRRVHCSQTDIGKCQFMYLSAPSTSPSTTTSIY